jgi:hypothetical protein
MEKIDNHLERLGNWISQYQKLGDLYPAIYNAYRLAEFEKKIIDTFPDNLNPNFKDSIVESITGSIDYFEELLPQIVIYDEFGSCPSGEVIAVSGVSGSMAVIDHIHSDDPYNVLWADGIIQEYSQIQKEQARESFIRSKLNSFFPKVGAEFEESVEVYKRFSGGVTNQKDGGISCRTVLEHLKGELFEKAKLLIRLRNPAKQKVNWREMTTELAFNGLGSIEYSILVNKELDWKNIHEELTFSAKGLVSETRISFEVKFMRYLDVLFEVLHLIDWAKIRVSAT